MSTNLNPAPGSGPTNAFDVESNIRRMIAEELEIQLGPFLDFVTDRIAEDSTADIDPLLTYKDVAKILAIDERTLRRRVAAGEFPSPMLVGTRAKRWPREQVMAWLVAHQGDAGA